MLNVTLSGVGLTEQLLAVTLCVSNQNNDTLAFRNVTADLDVAGAPLAEGTSILPVRLPPQSASVVPFTVVTTVRNAGPQLLSVVRTGAIGYRVHGTVTLEGPLGLTLPYSRSGRFDLVSGGLDLAASASDPKPAACARPS